MNDYPNAIERDASNCDSVTTPTTYDLSRYTFSCQTNIFTLTIKTLSQTDDGNCWKCGVRFSDTGPTNLATTCISVDKFALSLGLALGLGIGCFVTIFIILICCGCLDCCKCCRIFTHYQETKCCYATWYCVEKRCCNFFYCRPGTKRGSFFGGHNSKKERCGGCDSCQKICGCGWPDLCKSKGPRSCGGCICFCCVAGMEDEALLDLGDVTPANQTQTTAGNRLPPVHTIVQNKIESTRTFLPPLTSTHHGEPKRKKKKKKESHDVENN